MAFGGGVLFLLLATITVCYGHFIPNPTDLNENRSDFTPFVPLQKFERLDNGIPKVVWSNPSSLDAYEPLNLVSRFLEETFKNKPIEYRVTDMYTTQHNQVTHIYLRQLVNGLEVYNSETNFNVWNHSIISGASRFYLGSTNGLIVEPTLSATDAAYSIAEFLHIKVYSIQTTEGGSLISSELSFDPIPFKLVWVQGENGHSLQLAWSLILRQKDHWFNAFVGMNKNVLALHDWVAQESYLAIPIGTNDPGDCPGGGYPEVNCDNREFHRDPYDAVASPLGWHNQGNGREYTTTIGNNVYAQENVDGSTASDWIDNFRPDGGAENRYVFNINFAAEPIEYVNASIANLFFWNNIIHDVFYQYGFDEVSGNFQESNFGRGGRENDAVQANGQDGAGINNANFATPPDGERPRMRMYLYDKCSPMRDGDLAVGTVIHEYAHGISNRLTGGPSNTNCLGIDESGGMGEGWGDFFSVVFRQRSDYTRDNDFPFGGWQRNQSEGIRPYVYSTKMDVNPSTYAYCNKEEFEGVHAKGCVWATALYDGYWNIVDANGWSPNLYSKQRGNGMVLQDVIDGMKLQPCRPTFVDARDAILTADLINYEGANICDWWKAFSKRGLGVNAQSTPNGVIEDFEIPSDCVATITN